MKLTVVINWTPYHDMYKFSGQIHFSWQTLDLLEDRKTQKIGKLPRKKAGQLFNERDSAQADRQKILKLKVLIISTKQNKPCKILENIKIVHIQKK